MQSWIPYASDEWTIFQGAPLTGVRVVCIGLYEKNTLRSAEGNKIFKKGAVVLEYDDKSMRYDPADLIE